MTKHDEQKCEDWWKNKPEGFDLWLKSQIGAMLISQQLWDNLSNKIDGMSREIARLKQRIGE